MAGVAGRLSAWPDADSFILGRARVCAAELVKY